MIYQIPTENKQFIQTNRSNLLGNLWSTKSVDLQSNLGALRLGQKLVSVVTSTDDAQLATPAAFRFFDGRWWTVAGSIFKNTSEELTGSWSEDASTNAITTYDDESDLEVFDSKLWATAAGKLMSKAANGSGTGAWTDSTGSANITGRLNKLAYLRKFNRLYFIESDDEIASIDASGTMALSGDYNLDLGNTADLDGLCALCATSDRIWAGLEIADNDSSSDGGPANSGSIIEWDGISSQITKEYKIGAAKVLAFVVDPETDTPYAMDSKGRVLGFTGYGFKEVGRLPVGKKHLTGATASLSTSSFIKPNGLAFTNNRTILALINNQNDDSDSTINENLPSGIWELDLATGSFTHKHSFTLSAEGSSTVTDFGQNRIVESGAIALNYLSMDASSGSCQIVCGARYYTNASSSAYGVFVDAPDNASTDNEGQRAGYFVSTWLEAPLESIKETWQKAFIFHRQFLDGDDKIVIKYRTTEADPTEISITWVNTTSFTTTTNISDYVGYEVEGTQGTGSGGCAHIVSVSENAGTYTATLDNAFTGVTTGTAKVRLQNWIKAGEITGQSDEVGEVSIGAIAPRIQFKVYMQMTRDGEFYKLKPISAVHQAAV